MKKIDKDTRLFVNVGIDGSKSKFINIFNSLFEENNNNSSYLFYNIRDEDFKFFINNLKHSQIHGVNFESEYQQTIMNYLDNKSYECELCNFCESMIVSDSKYFGYITSGDAICELLNPKIDSRIAIIGADKKAISTLFSLKKYLPKRVTIFDEIVESSIEVTKYFHDLNIEFDYERVKDGFTLDFNKFDYLINLKNIYNFKPNIISNRDIILIDILKESKWLKDLSKKENFKFFGAFDFWIKRCEIDYRHWFNHTPLIPQNIYETIKKEYFEKVGV
ncbi:MAG: hypothetical protein HXX81_03120 [Campylobacterales bacterium]|nr:hypothetical protein [Campylobacterales bacterium]